MSARWSRYLISRNLATGISGHSCQPSENTWLLRPLIKTHAFLPVPESSFCHYKHNRANKYALKLGTSNQDFYINTHFESLSTKVKYWAHIVYCFMLSKTIDSSWKGSTGTEVSNEILVLTRNCATCGNQKNMSKESMCFYLWWYSKKEEILNLYLTCSSPFCLSEAEQQNICTPSYPNLAFKTAENWL